MDYLKTKGQQTLLKEIIVMNDVNLLIKIAGDLDQAGCYTEADILDQAIKALSTQETQS